MCAFVNLHCARIAKYSLINQAINQTNKIVQDAVLQPLLKLQTLKYINCECISKMNTSRNHYRKNTHNENTFFNSG